jgi:hypothetical protein
MKENAEAFFKNRSGNSDQVFSIHFEVEPRDQTEIEGG